MLWWCTSKPPQPCVNLVGLHFKVYNFPRPILELTSLPKVPSSHVCTSMVPIGLCLPHPNKLRKGWALALTHQLEYHRVHNDSTSPYLWSHTSRRSHSKRWFVLLQTPRRSDHRNSLSGTARSSWLDRVPDTVPGRTGSEWWWSPPLQSCWSWRAAAGWPLTPNRWRRSRGPVREAEGCEGPCFGGPMCSELCWREQFVTQSLVQSPSVT